MSITVRHATDEELALVRGTWRPQMRPRYRDASEMAPGHRGHAWGDRRYIGQGTAVEMLRRHIEAHTTTHDVLVAAVPFDEGDEAMAWASRSLVERDEEPAVCVVHFVYTLKAARREGLGSSLLRYIRQEAKTAGVQCVPGCMTDRGVMLWESEQSQ